MNRGKLPPVAEIATAEKLWLVESPADLKSQLTRSGLRKELERQAAWTIENYKYPQPSASGFLVAPSRSLNPFTSDNKCANPPCRIKGADDFVKTVCLYVDSIVVPDPFTAAFARHGVDYEDLYSLVNVYRHLLPFVREGIINFHSPVQRVCRDCNHLANERIEDFSDRILPEAISALKFSIANDRSILGVDCPILSFGSDHPIIWTIKLSNAESAKLRGNKTISAGEITKIVKPRVSAELKRMASNILFDMVMAKKSCATVLASARGELLCVAEVANIRPPLATIEQWEGLRSLRLPWIHDLTPEECLRLRVEARAALPKLRAKLATALQHPEDSAANLHAVVSELRAQVPDVEEEIKASSSLGEARYRVALEGLSAAFVLYGLASGAPAVAGAGLGALIASLAHAQQGAREATARQLKTVLAPAYVLVKAREILSARKIPNEVPTNRPNATGASSARRERTKRIR